MNGPTITAIAFTAYAVGDLAVAWMFAGPGMRWKGRLRGRLMGSVGTLIAMILVVIFWPCTLIALVEEDDEDDL